MRPFLLPSVLVQLAGASQVLLNGHTVAFPPTVILEGTDSANYNANIWMGSGASFPVAGAGGAGHGLVMQGSKGGHIMLELRNNGGADAVHIGSRSNNNPDATADTEAHYFRANGDAMHKGHLLIGGVSNVNPPKVILEASNSASFESNIWMGSGGEFPANAANAASHGLVMQGSKGGHIMLELRNNGGADAVHIGSRSNNNPDNPADFQSHEFRANGDATHKKNLYVGGNEINFGPALSKPNLRTISPSDFAVPANAGYASLSFNSLVGRSLRMMSAQLQLGGTVYGPSPYNHFGLTLSLLCAYGSCKCTIEQIQYRGNPAHCVFTGVGAGYMNGELRVYTGTNAGTANVGQIYGFFLGGAGQY